MFGLKVPDLVVIAVYFAAMVAVGIWASRRIRTREDFFLGGRRFGKLIQTFASFGQATSVSNPVGTTTTTVQNGAAGIWSSLNILFATPIYWFTSVWYRRMRLLTMGEFFEDRYGSKRMAAVYAAGMAVVTMLGLGLGFNAMSKTVLALTPKAVSELRPAELAEHANAEELARLEAADHATLAAADRSRLAELRIVAPRKVFSHLDEQILIFTVCLVVLAYAVAGGLEAAFVTDTIQGICILFLSVILLPFAFLEVNRRHGGSGVMDVFRTLHEKLPESYFEVFGSPAVVDFTWYYILALVVMVTLNVGVDPTVLTTTGSAKNEFTARFGFSAGSYLKRGCTILWGLLGLLAVLLYSKSVHDPDMAWGHATLNLLAPLGVGLVGLMIASLMAALMSTADCWMIVCSSLLTHNLYRLLVTSRPESHYIRVGRLLGGVVVIGGAFVALYFTSIFDLLKLLWEINVIFAATFWLGMLWRRATRKAAWASILATLVLFFLVPFALANLVPSLRRDPYLLKMTDPDPIHRFYTARPDDVALRGEEIAAWDRLAARDAASGPRPEPIEPGMRYRRTYQLPRRSLFWTQGVRADAAGALAGLGWPNLDLVLLDALGFDLAKRPFALSQTLRLLIRILFPFGILVVVSLLTRPGPEEGRAAARFYAKMKTPVLTDRAADELALARSLAEPARFDHRKLFPRSEWEFCRWNRLDVIGFGLSCLVTLAILGAFLLVVRIGS